MQCLRLLLLVAWCVLRPARGEEDTSVSCNCNGYSSRCYFDQELYDRSGHGGHCLDCAANRDGPNCERCKSNFYERSDGACIPCYCNEIGSRSLQCGSDGLCQCKPGVLGDKCDRCGENFYDFGQQGCKPCGCVTAGSHDNKPSCDPGSGICACKQNVEGHQCDACKPGFFNLDEENEFGCTPCFCYGHSSICTPAFGYSKGIIESSFVRGEERWGAQTDTGVPVSVSYNAITRSLGVASDSREKVYFLAPSRFLGDQRAAYNHDLSFQLHIDEVGPQATTEDIILEGANLVISAPIFAQGNTLPNIQKQEYTFRLHEDSKFGWSPRLSSRDFISLLSNLTSIKIRGTFTNKGKGFLDDVELETARRGVFGDPATWVEMCTCPKGYVGQYCESCAPGFRHLPANGGPFAQCIPCDCNNHADICDSETGRCICQHNTAGDQCERCSKGFYGNALKGTPNDCQPCPCPDGGSCIQLKDDTVVCLECPKGYAGPRCELCTDGYYGDPHGRHGPPKTCEKCECNENIDPNAVANCNRTTGECLKCIYNTGGFFCDQCLPGFYGDALARPKGDCRPCQCNFYGTVLERFGPPVCDQVSGQCQCKAHVRGLKCEMCEPGYFNLTSGTGCEDCKCDPVGSINSTCDPTTGQCFCRPGVMGRKCDVCEPFHYGFSLAGCRPCNCDVIGSLSLQCDASGQCSCRKNVEGIQCERCRENTYDKQAGCRDCEPCYNLVMDAVSVHREKLAELESLLQDIVSNPTVLSDEDFEVFLQEVQKDVEGLWSDTSRAVKSGEEKTVQQHLDELRQKIFKVETMLEKIVDSFADVADFATLARDDVTAAEDVINKARIDLNNAQIFLDVQGNDALNKAVDRSNQFGKQSAQMSEIARNARQMADKHEKEAEELQQLAYEARNISEEAFKLARKALGDQNNITKLIQTLEGDTKELLQLHQEAALQANESLTAARKIYQEALALSTDASTIAVPVINTTTLREQALSIHDNAEKIIKDVRDLMNSKGNLLVDIDSEVDITKALLERGLNEQQTTTELLADVFRAKEEADNAVQKANNILTEAEETLQTLEGFDMQVQESRGKAEDALQRVKDIELLINQAELRTSDAQSALKGAESNARDARDIAVDAQRNAESASEQAEGVRREADKTQKEASGLKDEADALASRIDVVEATVGGYEELLKDDKVLVDQAQQRANQAKANADEASSKVREAQEVVTRILEILHRSPDLDPSQLDQLEQRLNEAHEMYKQSGIDVSVAQLSDARSQQELRISNYKEELEILKIEVDNIEAIKLSLPDGCFRQTKLEP